jgi:hypothetical protein
MSVEVIPLVVPSREAELEALVSALRLELAELRGAEVARHLPPPEGTRLVFAGDARLCVGAGWVWVLVVAQGLIVRLRPATEDENAAASVMAAKIDKTLEQRREQAS